MRGDLAVLRRFRAGKWNSIACEPPDAGRIHVGAVQPTKELSLENLPAFELIEPGTLREKLNDAVLRGTKTATSRLLVLDEMAHCPAEPAGSRMRLLDSNSATAAIIEITRTLVLTLGEVGPEVAGAEGEWFANVDQWRTAHTRYWNSKLPDIRLHLSDDEWQINEETPVIVRFFTHIKEDR